MRVLHFDPFSGLAGDMFLAAAIDLGAPPEVVEEAIAALGVGGLGFETRRESRGGLSGLRFEVLRDGRPVAQAGDRSRHSEARSWADIRQLLGGSGLAAEVKELALQLFARLAEAEASAHGVEPDQVHFHEVGALDSIVDLVGAAAVFRHLAPERVTSGPVNVGSGAVETEHGVLPVPAPATAQLLLGVPSYSQGEGELLTPTGAVLLQELVDEFGAPTPGTARAIGYGLGSREVAGRPNAFRIWAGEGRAVAAEVAVVEAEIDDLSGEGFGFLFERLLVEGALDLYFTPVQMKKSRPGVLVTLLCRPAELERLAGLLLVESGSLGCRYSLWQRFEAARRSRAVETRFGTVVVKEATFGGRRIAVSPEYEDCRAAAEKHSVAWREVYDEALAKALG